MPTVAKQGDEFLANTQTAGSQSSPTIAGLANGGFVVSWQDEESPVSFSIKAQMYSAAGTKIGSELLVNTETTNSRSDPATTGLTGGGFVVSWIDQSGTLGDADGTSIKAQIYNASGAKVGSEFLVNTITENGQSYPDIAGIANGGFVVAWRDDSGTPPFGGSTEIVRAQIFEADGDKVGSEIVVVNENAEQWAPAVTPLNNGNFAVSWTFREPLSSAQGIRAQVFEPDGSKVGDEIVVNVPPGAFETYSDIAGLSEGGFVVAWADQSRSLGDSSGYAIHARIFDNAGSPTSTEFRVNTETSTGQTDPTVAGLAGGGFVVSWTDDSGTLGDSSPESVKAQVFDDTGDKIGTEFLVNTLTEGRQAASTVAALTNDGFVIAWNEGSGTVSPGYNVSVQLFSMENSDPTASETNDVATDEDIEAMPVQIGASDEDGDTLSYSVKAGFEPAKGSVSFASGSFTYSPNANANGPDSFTILIEDGEGGSAEQVVSVTISPVDDDPVAVNDNVNTEQDTTINFDTLTLLKNDEDVDGDILTVSQVSNPSNGSVVLSASTISFKPLTNFVGQAGFDYTLSDGNGGTDIGHVTVTVSNVNDAPVASPESIVATEDGPTVNGQLLATDLDGDELTFSPILTGQFAPGVSGLLINPDGSYTFDPSNAAYQGLAAGEVGEFLAGYFVSDGSETDDATITISVTGVNDAPIFNPSLIDIVTIAEIPAEFSVSASDIDGDVLSYSTDDPGNGVVTGGVGGTFTYISDPGFNGADMVTAIVSDGHGGMDSLELIVTVIGLPQADQWNLLTTSGYSGEIGGYGVVFAGTGTQIIEVLNLPGTIDFSSGFNAGDDAIILPGDAADWSIIRSGSDGIFSDGDTFAIVPVGPTGIPIAFDDGAYWFGIDDANIVLGDQVLTGVLTAIDTEPDGTPLPSGLDAEAIARLIMFPDSDATVGGNISVFGTNGSETLMLLRGDLTFDSSWNGGGDTAKFDDAAISFTARVLNSDVILEGTDSSAELPIGINGMTLDFDDDLRTLIYDVDLGQVMIGADVIGLDASPLS